MLPLKIIQQIICLKKLNEFWEKQLRFVKEYMYVFIFRTMYKIFIIYLLCRN